ncbi:uncharacterized protein LOC124193747 [Daphnia pulex]|uniref:uncharacterized protein LOC124193747 n=1 Tax=Daphnia pulex TaxID=6669 RepID=UPI001EDCB85B|nr:uncharacterized protein LOC124193747 [Daphnia pulex]
MMLSKFIFVWLLCLSAVFVQLPSASSIVWPKFHEKKKPIDQIVATIDAWFGCNNEKKRIDQLVGTIDALKQQIPAKNTLADMENALRREKAKNQELLNAISEHVTKEHELEQQKKTLESKTLDLDKKVNEISIKKELIEQQKKNLEKTIVYLDNKVETLLSNFTDCKENHEVLVQNVTNQLQSCETERKKEKEIADQSTLNIEAEKKMEKDRTSKLLEVEKGALRREKEKNYELLNAISEHVTKEHELQQQKKNLEQKTLDLDKKVLEISLNKELLEQQKKNLEQRIVYLDNKVVKLLSNFTTELKNCTVLKDSQSLMLEEEKGSSLRDKTALIANLELCEEKRKMLNNYVLDSFLRDSPYPGVEKYTRYAVARLGMLPIKHAKPLIPEFGPVINDVLSFRYPINIPSCQAAEITNNTSANPSVFIVIISGPGNFKKRNDIRETWLNHLSKSVLEKNLLGISTRFGFFLGKTQDNSIQKRIEEESQKHGDIVQIEMDDSFRNLTLKGIAVLNWVRQHCANVDLVFKVDDDIYVNVHNLVHFVRSNYQSNNSLFGHAWGPSDPARYNSQWYLPFEEYPWRHYPNYVQGAAYFMHASVVIPLLAASQTIPFNPFEDVFLAGMCTEKAGAKIKISKWPAFSIFWWLPSVPPPCDLWKFVGWPTDNQFATHSAVDDFYRNKTQCVVTESDGTIIKIIDFTDPVDFQFP